MIFKGNPEEYQFLEETKVDQFDERAEAILHLNGLMELFPVNGQNIVFNLKKSGAFEKWGSSSVIIDGMSREFKGGIAVTLNELNCI